MKRVTQNSEENSHANGHTERGREFIHKMVTPKKMVITTTSIATWKWEMHTRKGGCGGRRVTEEDKGGRRMAADDGCTAVNGTSNACVHTGGAGTAGAGQRVRAAGEQ